MRRTAHFKVRGQLERGGPTSGTLTIEQHGEDGLVTVRPHRSRRAYTIPLSLVASLVVVKAIKAELK